MIRVRSQLGDDIFGLWRVVQILIQKDGRRVSLVPNGDTFTSPEDAQQYAQGLAWRFLRQHLGFTNGEVVWDFYEKEESSMLKRNALEACLLLLTGMAIGATAAVLFAPESGAKTRKRLGKYARRTAEDLWEQGQEAIETAADRGKEYFETGKEKAREAVQTAAETVKKNILRQTD
jgi:gas vesicle protein